MSHEKHLRAFVRNENKNYKELRKTHPHQKQENNAPESMLKQKLLRRIRRKLCNADYRNVTVKNDDSKSVTESLVQRVEVLKVK